MANEKRLIDADAFFAEIERRFCVNCDYFDGKCEECLCLKVGDMLANTPTVDAVEVVRCKDCEHFNKRGYDEDNAHEEDSSLHMGWCAEWRRGTQACRFCSYGERRTDGV